MAFIAIVHVPDGPHPDGIVERIAELPDGYRLVGLFDFPNRAQLKCAGGCIRKNTSPATRDPMGFMKCSVCGYRNRKMRQWLLGALFDFLGANQYEGAPAAFRTPDHYGPSRDVV